MEIYESVASDLKGATKVYIDVKDHTEKDLNEARALIKANRTMSVHEVGDMWIVRRLCVPKITGRDLVKMGYNPAKGDHFRRIMESLAEAIGRQEVGEDNYEGQVLWVKENFAH